MITDNCWNCKTEIDLATAKHPTQLLENNGIVVLGESLCNDCLLESDMITLDEDELDHYEEY